MPFLETIIIPEPKRTLSISVCRKPMHADRYLHWNSHYHLLAKYSVINTLVHRAKAVCSNQELLRTEEQHIREVLTKCNYPTRALDRMGHKNYQQNKHNKANNKNNNIKSSGYTVIPYTKGLCESIKRICSTYGIQTYFKGNRTLENILLTPKDKDAI